LVEKLIINYY